MFSGAANVLWISISLLLTQMQCRYFVWNSIASLCLETEELFVILPELLVQLKCSPSAIVLFSIVVVIVLPFTTIVSNYATFYLFIYFILFLLSRLYLLPFSRLLLNLLQLFSENWRWVPLCNCLLLHLFIGDNYTGAPNVNFPKTSVRKTIWDLEFSEHLL